MTPRSMESKLFCNKPGSISQSNPITSDVGHYGDWRQAFFCQGLATGFQMQVSPWQGSGSSDDTGVNNIKIFCNKEHSPILGDGINWDAWSYQRFCQPKQAVCGIQTRVDKTRKGGDAAGLCNFRMKCCDVGNIKCKNGQEDWEIVKSCIGNMECEYTTKTGLQISTTASSISRKEISSRLNIGSSFTAFGATFATGFEYGIINNQESSQGQTNTNIKEESSTIRFKGTLYQRVIKCEGFTYYYDNQFKAE